ncbi:YhcH/YjgK/YiaL family protein [uncultured Bacteroides sp.]|uniref:YhcH/YjgK/YiaL family protein n=1 Tax=uncultured Bacteroides sp. TaxID=162156 RepID=UPI002AA87FF4|nr:YhcH/YjgK/YiaL family protein [uncultured Bacteroides sp.]
MKNKSFSRRLLSVGLLFVLCAFLSNALAENPSWNKKEAKKWCKTKEWANGFAPVPYKATNCVEFATQYHKNKELWDKMFRWLAQNDLLTMPEGTYEIDGKRCFIKVSDSKTRDASKSQIESHRQYIDFQYVARGTERFGLINPKDATPISEYKPDVIHYKAKKIKFVDSRPDFFFLFFPQNYHLAMVKAKKEEVVRLIVAKIEYLP